LLKFTEHLLRSSASSETVKRTRFAVVTNVAFGPSVPLLLFTNRLLCGSIDSYYRTVFVLLDVLGISLFLLQYLFIF